MQPRDTNAGGTSPTPEAIARRAYELFEQRGREPGHELEDWLLAEEELAAAAAPAVTAVAASEPAPGPRRAARPNRKSAPLSSGQR